MSSQRLARILRRTPGEAAFDRCFFPLAAVFVAGVVAMALTSTSSQSHKPSDKVGLSSNSLAPAWFCWGLFVAGVIIAFFWLRAAVSVAKAWRDPSAQILRFSALGLLVPLAWIGIRLLLLPFSR